MGVGITKAIGATEHGFPIVRIWLILWNLAPFFNFAFHFAGLRCLGFETEHLKERALWLLNVLPKRPNSNQTAFGGIAVLIFDVVLVTFALSLFWSPHCLLEEQWKQMFSQKSLQIKTIQESVFSRPISSNPSSTAADFLRRKIWLILFLGREYRPPHAWTHMAIHNLAALPYDRNSTAP
jgi:hypothetical protein